MAGGAIVGESRPRCSTRSGVEAKGDTFTVWLNSKQVSQYTSSKYPEPAPIGLQIHAGLVMKVEFRDLRALSL